MISSQKHRLKCFDAYCRPFMQGHNSALCIVTVWWDPSPGPPVWKTLNNPCAVAHVSKRSQRWLLEVQHHVGLPSAHAAFCMALAHCQEHFPPTFSFCLGPSLGMKSPDTVITHQQQKQCSRKRDPLLLLNSREQSRLSPSEDFLLSLQAGCLMLDSWILFPLSLLVTSVISFLWDYLSDVK